VGNDNQQPPQQPAEEDLLSQAMAAAQEFFAANWLHLVLVLAVVGAVAMGWRIYNYRHQAHTMTAWAELGSLPGGELQFILQPEQAEQIRQEAVTVTQDILQNSPQTSATPWVLLQLGSLQASSGDWTAAARSFSDLTTKYPESQPADPGKAALAASLESLGKYKEAADLYEGLAAGGGHPYHLLSAARCRELSDDLAAAKRLYGELRDMKAGDADLADMAAARLDDISLGHPLPVPPPVTPAAPVPAPGMVPSVPAATQVGAPLAVPPVAPVEPQPAPAKPAAPGE